MYTENTAIAEATIKKNINERHLLWHYFHFR